MSGCALMFSLVTCVFALIAYAEIMIIKRSGGIMNISPEDAGPDGKDLKKNMDEALEAEEKRYRNDDIY